MNRLPGKSLMALALTLVVPLGMFVSQASFAADGQATGLIDKDFETAVRKFVSRRFYRRINASDEQRQKLDSIWTSTMETTRPERERLRQGLLELSDLMASDAATDEQISQKAHELRAMHEKINDQRLDSILKARKVLTPEQRKKVHARIADRISGGGAALQSKRLGMLPALISAVKPLADEE
jgi:Spy/CpxP family protein refolding chaperone